MCCVDDNALAVDPNVRGVHWQKAHALMEGARWEEAFATLEIAQMEDKNNKYVYSFTALLEHKIGRPAAALKAVRKHLALAPL